MGQMVEYNAHLIQYRESIVLNVLHFCAFIVAVPCLAVPSFILDRTLHSTCDVSFNAVFHALHFYPMHVLKQRLTIISCVHLPSKKKKKLETGNKDAVMFS